MAYHSPEPTVSEPASRKRWSALGCLPLLGTLVFGLVSYAGFDRELSPIVMARASQQWPTVQGRIGEANAIYFAEQKSKRDGFYPAGYRYHVLYTYTVARKPYKNNRLRFTSDKEIFPDESSARALISDFKSGATVPVYYHPDIPAISTLTHDYRLSPSGIGYCLLLTTLTVLCTVAAYLMARRTP
jgi:hypothetical protein